MRIEALGGSSELQQELDAFTGESPTDFLVAYILSVQELAIALRPGEELRVVVTFKNTDGKLQSTVRMDTVESVKTHLIATDDLGSKVLA